MILGGLTFGMNTVPEVLIRLYPLISENRGRGPRITRRFTGNAPFCRVQIRVFLTASALLAAIGSVPDRKPAKLDTHSAYVCSVR